MDNVFVTYYAAPKTDFTVAVDEAERSVIFELKNIENIQPEQIDYVEMGSPGNKGYRKYTHNMNQFLGKTIRLRFQSVDTSAYPMLF
ncbi:MAG: hypothetical protein H7Y20_04730 [Bryobacteraceae bacterium]|nr:hypothetical protein [Bryobacteraceae bacterium]